MQLDLKPTAQSTYARTLIGRGCPHNLAHAAAAILATEPAEEGRTVEEKATIGRAWANCTQ